MRSKLTNDDQQLATLSQSNITHTEQAITAPHKRGHDVISRLVTLTMCLCVSGTMVSGCYPERVDSVKLMNEGIKLYQSGKRRPALRVLERSAQRDPTNHRAPFYRGLVFNEMGLADQDERHFRDAVKSFEASAKVNQNDPEVFFQLGIAYKSLEDYRDALNAFEKASEIQAHGQAHYHSGEIYLTLEEYNRAQESFRAAITAQPDYGVAYTALSKLYRRFKKRSEAVIVLKNAIENDPDEVGHYRDLGEVYTDLKQFTRAVEWLEKAQQMSPYDAPITFLLGVAYLQVDDEQSAEVSLRKYLGMSHRTAERIMVLKARQILKKLQKRRR